MEITAIASKINAIIINTMMIFFFISDIAVPSLNSTLSGPARQATETTLPSPMQSRRAATAFPIPIWNSALWMQTQAMISKYISGSAEHALRRQSVFHGTPGNSAGCTAKEKDRHQHPNTGCRPQSRAQAGRGCTRKGSSSCSRLPFPSPVRGARRRVENAPGRFSSGSGVFSQT